ILGTIASSSMAVAGVIFSVTLVALSLSSQEFGPRLLKNFKSDRVNQGVLGLFLGTFVYSLLILRAVRGDDGIGSASHVPYLGVFIAIVLAVANVIALAYLI